MGVEKNIAGGAAERITVRHGDSREVLKGFPDNHFDSVVTDPPYALTSIVKRFGKPGAAPAKGNAAYMRASAGFMGQAWDNGETAFDPEFWAEVLRVLKPGGHVAAFSGTRTYHRMACAIEDAGFEIRDQLAWTYGSGFPKSHDVSKGIDKKLGCERTKVRIDASAVRNPKTSGAGRDGAEGSSRPFIESAMARGFHEAVSDEAVSDEAGQWQGWGTALKPAWEPICLGRKPLVGTVAANVLAFGAGALNIDGCRVQYASDDDRTAAAAAAAAAAAHRSGQDSAGVVDFAGRDPASLSTFMQKAALGRWPANIILDGSDEVAALFPDTASGGYPPEGGQRSHGTTFGAPNARGERRFTSSEGSAARFFYTAKADAGDRIGSKHPTVKPVDLMQWLVRLITPPGGLVLEPFAGSGTTGEAAFREGMRCVMIEREANFVADIERRIGLLMAGPEERSRSAIKAKIADGRVKDDAGPLFGGGEAA